MDFAKINLSKDAETGAWMAVEHPVTGEIVEGTRIHLRGQDGQTYKSAYAKIMQKYQGKKKLSASVIERQASELLAALTIGWEGIESGNKAIEFSFEAAADLYEQQPWLRDQIDRFVADRGNFAKLK